MTEETTNLGAHRAPVEWPANDLLFLDLSLGRSAADFRLELSIRDIGLIRPPLAAAPSGGKPIILSGQRRVNALKKLGSKTVPLIFLPPKPGEAPCWAHPECPEAVLRPAQIMIALSENTDRGFNNAELARGAALLKPAPDSPAKTRLLSLMGLSSPRLCDSAAGAALLPESFQEALALGQVDLSDVYEMRSFSLPEKMELLRLFLRLRPSRQKRKQWIEYLNDLKVRDSLDLSLFLREHFLDLASQAREEEGRSRLFSLRFPKLSGILKRREDLIKSLKLPPGVSFSCDPAMEDPSAVLKFDFSNPEHLRDKLTELLAIASSSARLRKIFENDWESG